ncbi:MAG: AraC family transcriptional regulator [Candidatus Kapabacteria bacterium]|nr:AraC family transcriptional regulator [Candidatus Kapabacteria bacterium]
MPASLPAPILARQHEIMSEYYRLLDAHLLEVEKGNVEEMFGVRDFAELLHIHPTHLSNTIKHVTGRSPCDVFEERLCEVAKKLLADTSMPITEVARIMTYDPSNFTKFFKRFAGITPRAFREKLFHERIMNGSTIGNPHHLN